MMKTNATHNRTPFNFKRTVSTLLCLSALIAAPAAWAQTWEDLPSDSQKTLRPLRLSWSDLSDAQKQSWLRRVPELKSMSGEQLSNAQERMAEWAALSGQQRMQVQQRLQNSKQPDPNIRAKLWKDYTGQ